MDSVRLGAKSATGLSVGCRTFGRGFDVSKKKYLPNNPVPMQWSCTLPIVLWRSALTNYYIWAYVVGNRTIPLSLALQEGWFESSLWSFLSDACVLARKGIVLSPGYRLSPYIPFLSTNHSVRKFLHRSLCQRVNTCYRGLRLTILASESDFESEQKYLAYHA